MFRYACGVCLPACADVHVEPRSPYPVSSTVALRFVSEAGSLTETGACLVLDWLSNEFWVCLCLPLGSHCWGSRCAVSSRGACLLLVPQFWASRWAVSSGGVSVSMPRSPVLGFQMSSEFWGCVSIPSTPSAPVLGFQMSHVFWGVSVSSTATLGFCRALEVLTLASTLGQQTPSHSFPHSL